MQNTWFKCGKIPQIAEGLAGMFSFSIFFLKINDFVILLCHVHVQALNMIC